MKIALRTAFAITGLAALISLTFYACKKPIADVDLIVNTSGLSKSPMLVQFANANSSSTTPLPELFDVTISGPGADLVRVDGGGSNFTVTNGLLPLTLSSAAKPSDTNPIIFNVYAELDGFVPVSKTFTITADTAITTVFKLTEYANPPAGVAIVNKTTALNHGTSDSVVLAAYDNTTAENVKITIPKGTTMLNALGSPIDASQLSSSLIYYGTTDAEGYNAFPGGFNPPGSSFLSAGYFSLNLLAGTTPVARFSQPVKVTFKLNPALTNPTTNAPVQFADGIPFWVRNEATGEWQSLGTQIIADYDTGAKLAVSYNTDQLTTLGAIWQAYDCGSPSITFHLSDKNAKLTDYALALESPTGQFVGGPYGDKWVSHTINITDGYKVVTGTPSFGKLKAVIYSDPGNPASKVFESPLFDACATGNVDVNLNVPAQPDYIKTIITSSALCIDRNVKTQPSTWLQVKDVTTGKVSYVYMRNGAVTTRMVNKHSYSIKTLFAYNEYGTKAFMVDRTKSSGTIDNLTGMYGSFTYSSASTTLNISTTFNINCH